MKIAGLEQQIDELTRDKENLYQKIEELKATAGRHRDECNKCEKELAQLQAEFDRLKADNEEKERQIDSLTETKIIVEKENEELKKQLKKLNADYDDAVEKKPPV